MGATQILLRVKVQGRGRWTPVCLRLGADRTVVDRTSVLIGGRTAFDDGSVVAVPGHQDGSVNYTLRVGDAEDATDRIVFAVAADDDSPLSQAATIAVAFLDADTRFQRARATFGGELGEERAAVLFEVYRHAGTWRVWVVGQGYRAGLSALLAEHGAAAHVPARRPDRAPAPQVDRERPPREPTARVLGPEPDLLARPTTVGPGSLLLRGGTLNERTLTPLTGVHEDALGHAVVAIAVGLDRACEAWALPLWIDEARRGSRAGTWPFLMAGGDEVLSTGRPHGPEDADLYAWMLAWEWRVYTYRLESWTGQAGVAIAEGTTGLRLVGDELELGPRKSRRAPVGPPADDAAWDGLAREALDLSRAVRRITRSFPRRHHAKPTAERAQVTTEGLAEQVGRECGAGKAAATATAVSGDLTVVLTLWYSAQRSIDTLADIVAGVAALHRGRDDEGDRLAQQLADMTAGLDAAWKELGGA